MKIFICDNNKLLCDNLKKIILEIIYENDISAELTTFYHADDLMNIVIKSIPDLILLDISLENNNGINIAKTLNRDYPKTKIVYITSHLEFVKDIYETDFQNILIKPIEKEKLQKVLMAIYKKDILVIKSGNKVFRINQNDIYYIESKKRLAYIHTSDELYICYRKLSDLLSQLNQSFYMCHKSFIVNMNSIKKVSPTFLFLNNGDMIPVSRSLFKEFNKAFINYLGDLL